MPYGRYPDRVKAFRKWSNDRVDKAEINDKVTGSKVSGLAGQRRRQAKRRRSRAKKRKELNNA